MKNGWLNKVWRLPWSGSDVPHALLDINRRCNLSCRSCYNVAEGEDKPLSLIEQELDALMTMRRLDSVSIIGGEPTLHDDLLNVVRLITNRGLHSELFTNGMLLNDSRTEELARAGLGMVFLHIQKDQQREDWHIKNGEPNVDQLITEKAELLHRHGIQAGLTVTAYSDRKDEILHLIDVCLENPLINCLLITMDTDVKSMELVAGDIIEGFTSLDQGYTREKRKGMTLAQWSGLLNNGRGLAPFCFLGSNRDENDPRWLSFFAVCGYENDRLKEMTSLEPSLAEKGFMAVSKMMKGRYPFFNDPDEGRLKVQFGLNTFLGGNLKKNLNFICKTAGKGLAFSSTRILFQVPAEVGYDGAVIHCRHCPDAVLKNGHLVPVCICDKIRS